MKAHHRLLLLLLSATCLLIALACQAPLSPVSFDGQRAYAHVKAQCEFGPRPTGSRALEQTGDYILDKLKKQGWATEEQAFTYRGTPVRNLIGKAGKGPLLILGAHYDTRRRAEQESEDFKEKMKRRPAVEGTISEMTRKHGVRRARYRGKDKVRLQALFTGAATNLKRLARALAARKQAPVGAAAGC